MISQDKLSDIARCAWRIRRYAVRMGEVQGQGYIGQALGYADVLARNGVQVPVISFQEIGNDVQVRPLRAMGPRDLGLD